MNLDIAKSHFEWLFNALINEDREHLQNEAMYSVISMRKLEEGE